MKTKRYASQVIAEGDRHTVQIKLRMDPADAATLRGLAAAWKMTLSETVSTLVQEKVKETEE